MHSKSSLRKPGNSLGQICEVSLYQREFSKQFESRCKEKKNIGTETAGKTKYISKIKF